jgi:ParB family chromosome partitioning protein
MKSNKLGKGLGELLGEVESSYNNELNIQEGSIFVDIEKISVNPYQPRKYFNKNKIQELADSIKEHGLLQPILLIKSNNNFILIAGERRLRATVSNGDNKIKALILDYEVEYIKELSLVENIQREDLSAIEIAKSYNELISEYNITHEELAKKVKKGRSSITNTLRLLQLPEWIQDKVISQELSAGQARAIINLSPKEQKQLVNDISQENIPTSKLEKIVKELKNPNKSTSKVSNKITQDINKDKISIITQILENKNIKSSVLNNKLIISLDKDMQIDNFLRLIRPS